MADTAGQPLFASLVERFGLQAALSLLPFLNQDASAASKGFAGASLAGTGANVAGKLSGTPALSSLGQGLGTALGAATTGYNLYNTATNPNLSTKQKAAHSGGSVADLIFSTLFPAYGAGKALQAVGAIMERSGSPQVRGAGRSVDYAVEPAGAKSFLDVLRADKSPKAAFNAQGGPRGLVLDLLGPLGIIARGTGAGDKVARGVMDYGPIPFGGKLASMLGFGSKPTTGTSFRREAGSIFDKIPQLKGVNTSRYNIDPTTYAGLPQAVKDNATAMSQRLAALAPHAASNPQAYQNQIAAMLLNRFGANLPSGV